MRTLALTLALVLALLLPSGAAGAKALTVVAFEAHPLEYEDALGAAAGVNVDIARAVLARLGHDVRFLFVPWRRALEMVKDGYADAILDAGYNAGRATYLHYPDEPIYLEEIYAFKLARRDLSLDAGLANAGEYSVGVGRGHYYGELVDQALARGAFRRAEAEGDVGLNINKLLEGRLDMVLGVLLPFEYMLRERGLSDTVDLVPCTGTGAPCKLGESRTFLAFSKALHGPMLAEKTGLVLRRMRRDGELERFAAPYR